MIWHPDTCECVIEFFSTGNNKDSFKKFIRKCKDHNTFEEALNTNQHKNNPKKFPLDKKKK